MEFVKCSCEGFEVENKRFLHGRDLGHRLKGAKQAASPAELQQHLFLSAFLSEATDGLAKPVECVNELAGYTSGTVAQYIPCHIM